MLIVLDSDSEMQDHSQNDLEPVFESHGLGKSERHFIKELILGDEEESKGLADFQWKGLEPAKMFLILYCIDCS